MLESIIAVSAAAGALTIAILGWLNSKEPFDMKKFIGSAITAIVAGIGVAVTFNVDQGLTAVCVMTAFLTGAGADAGRKAIVNKITNS